MRGFRRLAVAGGAIVGVSILAYGGDGRATFPKSRAPIVAAQAALPRPDNFVFDVDLSGDQEPAWYLDDLRGVAEWHGVLVVDAARHQVVNLATLEVYGGEGGADGEFREPHGLAVGDAIYVADTGNDRVQKFTLDWEWVAAWGGSGDPLGLNRPEGVAVAPDGSVLVADTGNGRVVRVSAEGAELGAWAVGADGQALVRPTGIAVSDAGTVFVADAGTGLVERFDVEGQALGVFGAGVVPDGAALVAVTEAAASPDGSSPDATVVWVGAPDSGAVVGVDLSGAGVNASRFAGLTAIGKSGEGVLVTSSHEHPRGSWYARPNVDRLGNEGDPVALVGTDAPWPLYLSNTSSAVAAPGGRIVVSRVESPGIGIFWPNGFPMSSWDSSAWRTPDSPTGSCQGPSSVDVSATAEVFLANVCGGAVEKWSMNGDAQASWPLVADGVVAEVSAVAALEGGGFVVADGINDELAVFDPEGRLIRRLGGPGSEDNQLSLPRWSDSYVGIGLDSDAAGRILVSDEYNARIKVFAADGILDQVIDPAPDREWLARYGPGPLRAAADGSIYLSDAGFEPTLVQRFTPEGTVIAVAGVMCSDIADNRGCGGTWNDEPDGLEQRPLLAPSADGLVTVDGRGFQWFGPEGEWQALFRPRWTADEPTVGLARSLGVGSGDGATVAAEWKGVLRISSEGRLTRVRNAIASSEVVTTTYRTVPFMYPSSAITVRSGNTFVLDWAGRLSLHHGPDLALTKLLSPNINEVSVGDAVLEGADGLVYVQNSHPDLDGRQGFVVYDEAGNFIRTIPTDRDGGDAAIAPDGTAYFVAEGVSPPQIVVVPPGGDMLNWRSIEPPVGDFLESVAVDTANVPSWTDHVLWVTGSSGQLVRLLPDGTVLDTWDGAAPGVGPLVYPRSVRVAPDGSLWVLHHGGMRLRHYTLGHRGGWRATYYDGLSGAGSPISAERVWDPAGVGAVPPPGLIPGRWSQRLERVMDLTPGTHTFAVHADGGARLWVGDRLVIDKSAQLTVDEEAQVTVPGGLIRVVAVYSNHSAGTDFRLTVPDEAVPTATPPPATPTQAATSPPPPAATPDRRATAAARARTLYLPLVRRDLDPPYIDDFSDPATGWPELDNASTLLEYRDDEYRILNRTADSGAFVLSDIRRKNLDAQIRVRAVGSSRGAHGLLFASEVEQIQPLTVKTQFMFVVQPNVQQWGLFLCTETCGRVQLGNARSIKKDGGWNTLRVTWQKPWLRLYLNGDQVWQRFQGPYNAVLYHGIVASPLDASFDSRFDDYVVREAWEPTADRGALEWRRPAGSSGSAGPVPYGLLPALATLD